MPVYDFKCEKCNKQYEIKMKLAEHSELKGKMPCQECGEILIQNVAPLRFGLKGNGWYDQGYGLTCMETDKNLDYEKRVEDFANTMQEKDKTAAKQGNDPL